MKTLSPSIDDLHSDAVNIHHVLDASIASLRECDFGIGENRDLDLDRAYSLVRVARGLIEQLTENLGKMNERGAGQ